MVKMATCTQKCEQKWLKFNIRAEGRGLEQRYPGWKKIEKLTIGGEGGTIIRESRVQAKMYKVIVFDM